MIEPDAMAELDDSIRIYSDEGCPLTLIPRTGGVDAQRWLAQHSGTVLHLVGEHGAVLLRGFELPASTQFAAAAGGLCPDLVTDYGDLSDEPDEAELYGATVYPEQQPIHFHNESAQTGRWPLYLFFYCDQPADAGGATRIVDSRDLLAAMPDEMKQALRSRRIRYQRCHYPHLDSSWQSLYGSEDPRAAEQACMAAGQDFDWPERDVLRTRIQLPAIQPHPRSGEQTLFHQLFLFHPSQIDEGTQEGLQSLYEDDLRPRYCTWEDGEPIDDEWIAQLSELYRRHSVAVRWQRGDMLIIDNARIAHSRMPYQGSRRVLVAMGRMQEGAADTVSGSSADEPAWIPGPAPARVGYPRVHELVHAQADRTPEAIAIEFDDVTWSYAELMARTNSVARALRQRGVAAGARVAISGPRQPWTVAALLGCWSNGQVVVPVDESLPRLRQGEMVRQAEVEYVLHTGAEALPVEALHTIFLHELDVAEAVELAPRSAPDDAAYVFFTSGSSGAPKAVLGAHNSLSHFLGWQGREFDVGPGDRLGQLTGLGFDVLLRDLFLPLTRGATLCMPPLTLDLANPWAWLEQRRITLLHAVPTLATLWLENPRQSSARNSVRLVCFAGEPLPDTLVQGCRALMSECVEIVNLYGPTETTLAKCFYRVPAAPTAGVQPIGQPLPGAQVLLLNEAGRPVAQGQTGQIVIRTPYGSLGYLDPQLQYLRPLATDASVSDSAYFTGDLGRRRTDGELDILGRADDQIKINGVRVEPTEVAAVLAGHPGLRQVHVQADRGGAGGLRAFLVPASERPTDSELGSYLARRLPPAMLPREYVWLNELPVTGNGKIDRAALSSLASRTQRRGSEAGAPRGEIEVHLGELWRELLVLPAVDRSDDFFRLGGHSLLAVQLLARLCEVYGEGVNLRLLFEHPILAEMAARIGEVIRAPAQAIERREHAGPVPLSFSQERFWFLSRMDPDSGAYNIPGAMRCRGELDAGLMQRALRRLCERYVGLRTQFIEQDGEPLQLVLPEVELPLRRHDLRGNSGQEQRQQLDALALGALREPIPMDAAPLARVLLVRLADDEHLLSYTLHHAIADGWSNLLFNQELQRTYVALRDDSVPVAARKPPLDYRDYALWERTQLARLGGQQRDYWKSQLAQPPEPLQLPLDHPRASAGEALSGSCQLDIPGPLVARLAAAWPESGATVFMKLLAVFELLLYRVSGADDFCVGTPVARRTTRETETVLGCFINTLAIRARMDPSQTFVELLHAVRETTLDAFANQDLPFHQVVEAVAPRRDPDRHPLFQVLFNSLHFEQPETRLPDLHMCREWALPPQAKFDLSLYARILPGGVDLHLVYNARLFDQARMRNLLRDFLELIEACLDQPQQPLGAPLAQAPVRQRRAMPTPLRVEAEADSVDGALRPALTSIWCELLGLDEISPDADFFQLGGHSLLGVRMVDRIERELRLQVSLRSLFENPTIAALSSLLEGRARVGARPMQRVDGLRLSLDQQELHRLHREGADGHYYNVPRAVRCSGRHLREDLLRRALSQVMQRHSVLRMRYGADGVPSLGDPAQVVFRSEDLSQLAPAAARRQQAAIIDQEAAYRFDLERELPLRLTLIRVAPEEQVLVVVAHHICADCWSMGLPFQAVMEEDDPWHLGVFFRDLLSIYDALARGAVADLPELPIQYSDFSHWQGMELSSETHEQQRAFWQQQLHGAPRLIELPLDKPRPSGRGLRGERREFELPDGLLAPLEHQRRAYNTSLFVTMLAAYGISLWNWCGVEDALVGTPIANRNRSEVEGLIGLLANALVLRVKTDGDQSLAEYLRDVHRMVAQSVAHQEYPFSQLVRDFPELDPARAPLFQVRFVLQHVPEATLEVPGMAVTPVRFDRGVSKYELSLILVVQGERMRGWCEYSTDLFERDTIDRFCRDYVAVLNSMVEAMANNDAGRSLRDIVEFAVPSDVVSA